jgi:uncharacterized protein (TIGR00255 family)
MSGVLSMTGFASVEGAFPDKKGQQGRGFGLTVKAVNHRHLDLSVRLPMGMDALEPALRKAVKAEVRRGHVELTLMFEKVSTTALVEVDEVLLEAYVSALAQAGVRFGLKQEPDLNGLMRMPGVMSASTKALSAVEIEAPVLEAMGSLLSRFNAARAAEGEALAADLRAVMTGLATLAEEARTLREGMAVAEFARLKGKLEELLGGSGVSEERLVTEAAVIAGRGDVEEELVRLRTHVERFLELLDGGGEVGRQLDFLLQEMNREANTLLSKSGGNAGGAGLRLTEIGLEMKVGLERAREQVQNLE